MKPKWKIQSLGPASPVASGAKFTYQSYACADSLANTVVGNSSNLIIPRMLLCHFQPYECQNLWSNGICLHDDWKCNGRNDCGDNSDEIELWEQYSPHHPLGRPLTAKPAVADYSGYVKSGWVPACLAIGIILGLVLYFAVPRIVNKIRGRGSNYSRMGDDSS
ncbi:hypothetical protein Btru_050265 [Bulinus truncatus]|nr:hypothetical protein Btru_050265 [Bulinus truncatus]